MDNTYVKHLGQNWLSYLDMSDAFDAAAPMAPTKDERLFFLQLQSFGILNTHRL